MKVSVYFILIFRILQVEFVPEIPFSYRSPFFWLGLRKGQKLEEVVSTSLVGENLLKSFKDSRECNGTLSYYCIVWGQL